MSNHGNGGAGVALPSTARGRLHLPPASVGEHINHEWHVLLWQVRGGSDFVIGQQHRAVQVGHALWIPSGVRHGFTTRSNSVLLPMFFDVAETATTLREPTAIAVDRDLRTLFLAFIQTTYSIIRPHVNIARQILALIEDRPVLAAELPVPTSRAASSVAAALRFNPGDDRTAEELAEAAHASLRTVERAFRAETGMTLRQYRIRTRIAAARVLLRSPATVDAVARRVGYADTSAFRRVFKEHVGLTPSGYVTRFGAQP